MWLPAERLKLTHEERSSLAQLLRDEGTPKRLMLRAAIVTGASKGTSNTQLARELSVSRQTVIHWRQAFERLGMRGVFPAAPAANVKVPAGVRARTEPAEGRENPRGALGIVGVFVGPRDKALAFSMDRAAAPVEAGAARTTDYVRGLIRLFFNALALLLEVNLGEDAAGQPPLFLEFLERIDQATPEQQVRIIVDSQGSHRATPMKEWFDAHRRIHVHCTPMGSSWIGLAKRWFLSELGSEKMQYGAPPGVAELVIAIGEHIEESERRRGTFVWAAAAGGFSATV